MLTFCDALTTSGCAAAGNTLGTLREHKRSRAVQAAALVAIGEAVQTWGPCFRWLMQLLPDWSLFGRPSRVG